MSINNSQLLVLETSLLLINYHKRKSGSYLEVYQVYTTEQSFVALEKFLDKNLLQKQHIDITYHVIKKINDDTIQEITKFLSDKKFSKDENNYRLLVKNLKFIHSHTTKSYFYEDKEDFFSNYPSTQK